MTACVTESIRARVRAAASSMRHGTTNRQPERRHTVIQIGDRGRGGRARIRIDDDDDG